MKLTSSLSLIDDKKLPVACISSRIFNYGDNYFMVGLKHAVIWAHSETSVLVTAHWVGGLLGSSNLFLHSNLISQKALHILVATL